MNKIFTYIHKISLIGFVIPIVITVISSCGCTFAPYPIKDIMFWLFSALLTSFLLTDPLTIQLFHNIKTRIKNKQERDKILDSLINEREVVQGKLRLIEEEIKAIHSEEGETERFVHKFLKESGTELVTKKEIAGIFYEFDKRLKSLEGSTTQNSTPEEKHPLNQRNPK